MITPNQPPADLKGEKLVAWYQQENARIRAELEAAKQPRELRLKVSEKGAISVYGVNAKFPVTLYPEQWARVLTFMSTNLNPFINANKGQLKFKS